MSGRSPDFPDDKTAPERRKNLTEQEIKDLELAGGVEGGMQAGRGGGPAAPEDKKAEKADEATHDAKPSHN
jgi:hypothetical protein